MPTRVGETLPLFMRRPLARRRDPVSSQFAAHDVRASGRLGKQAAAVLQGIREHPGLTSRELAVVMDVDRYTPSRRLPYLEGLGYVKRAQRRRCRISKKLSQTWLPQNIGGK